MVFFQIHQFSFPSAQKGFGEGFPNALANAITKQLAKYEAKI
jgi:hypothetical protein